VVERSHFELGRLAAGLKPFRLHWFARLGSTSDQAIRLRRAGGLFAPAVVLCGRQTAGRGRGSNSWWSGSHGGVLTATFALAVHERLAPQELPLIAGLALRAAAAELTDQPNIQLKWPNDVVFRGRKIAGLLCERVSNVDLVGVGLNVNLVPSSAPAELRDRITSLQQIGGRRYDMTDVLLTLAAHLRGMVRRRVQQPFSIFVREYTLHDSLAGKRVAVTDGAEQSTVTGRCEGVDSVGRLLIRRGRVLHRVVAGNISMMETDRAKERSCLTQHL
jgi:BirA family transcriptional regulator, biotin operon repressor / biotin---[acetyl-CoA-carboxylase] ligase